MTSPVFFDSTGNRRKTVNRAVRLLLLAILIAAIVFAATLVKVPAAPPLEIGQEREQPLPFLTHVARLKHRLVGPPHKLSSDQPLRIGFHVPWDPDSATSLRKHFDSLDWVVAADATINANATSIKLADDTTLQALKRNRMHRVETLLMVQNISNGHWDSTGTAALLANTHRRAALIERVLDAARAGGWNGVVFDIENIPASSLPDYLAMLHQAHARLGRFGLFMAATVPAGEPEWDLAAFGRASDAVILMNYDQHWQGGTPGPIASADWFSAQLADARARVPAKKLIVAIGSYGYDWHDGRADALTLEEAWLAAHDSEDVPRFDPASGNSGFAYDENGKRHTIWMMDAATSWNQITQLDGLKGVALWRLGSEDPGFWEVLNAWRNHRRPQLETIPPPQGTDVDGNGEILRIAAAPRGGQRAISFARDGSVASESYAALPTPYEIRRDGGNDPKLIVLTFDDGPDPAYTPRILSILGKEKVPATFFVIGENALEHPELLRQIVAGGNEIGNHSYTHPNLAEVSDFGARLELNATQRLIEAYTGRSTRLFRAPYFGDAEPTTADELRPAQIAQDRGYSIVGLHVDPGDWRNRSSAEIIERTLAQIHAGNDERSANVVLLHDAGGNREQTVAALGPLIERLRAEGYRFVPVSTLVGLPRDAVMPPVASGDRFAVDSDVAVFLVLAGLGYALRWLFFFAIALGIARAVLMTALALVDRRAQRAPASSDFRPSVSVIIPAYNEERVIVASIARVLEGDFPEIELIVADDGSKDATSTLVAEHYSHDPRVKLLTLVNGGKASALNRALTKAHGEVIIALDADTQFLPDTISRLVRWFADERIGAVAGNARVGNRINLVTRWQAIEYVTAQNVERRALDALGAITVVPGAVGAWRRSALDAVGGYPEDTLAEDQDLTIAIQRQGWRVAYDVTALALTEAPETFRALAKQRYRWSFGTLQCLWKHRAVLSAGRPRGLAWFGMPQAWLFQILFAAISPLIDLALVISIAETVLRIHQHGWAQAQGDVLRMGVYWVAFVTIDLVAGWIAYRLEPTRQRFPGLLMLAQRLVYRQLMYSVVIRSIAAALRGRMVGWGKLERTGTVTVSG